MIRTEPDVHSPAGLMGEDKGRKDQSPLSLFYLTAIDVGRRAGARGSRANSEMFEITLILKYSDSIRLRAT